MENREIDRLIANEITNYVSMTTAWNPIDNIYGTLPNYSTNIQDAWEIVDLFKNKNIYTDIRTIKEGYNVSLFELNEERDYDWLIVDIEAKTAPMAICLAAITYYEIYIK